MKILCGFFCLLVSIFAVSSERAFAQKETAINAAQPKVLVLTPYRCDIAAELRKEASAQEKLMNGGLIKTFTFRHYISYVTKEVLSHALFERLPKAQVVLDAGSNVGTLKALQKQTDSLHYDFIVNYPTVRLYKENGATKGTVQVQLFDVRLRRFLIDTSITEDASNHGFTYSCTDGTIVCPIHNVLEKFIEYASYLITTESPYYKQLKTSRQGQYQQLIEDHYAQPLDSSFLAVVGLGDSMIRKQDSTVTSPLLYQVISNKEKTKYKAFILEEIDSQQMVLTFRMLSGLYAHERWYSARSGSTSFPASDVEVGKKQFFYQGLMSDGFYKENTNEEDPAFWERGVFERITDRKSPYEEDNKIANNKRFIGEYVMVRDAIKKEEESHQKAIEDSLTEALITPYFLHSGNSNLTPSVIGFLWRDPSLSLAIVPLAVHSSKGKPAIKQYWMISKDSLGQFKVFEWTYFPSAEIKSLGPYPSVVFEDFKPIAAWDWSYDYLDDQAFWSQFVFKQDHNQYVYLKPLE